VAGRSGPFRRLRESLAKSRRALQAELSASLFEHLDRGAWERIERALILADVGVPATAEAVSRLEADVEAGRVRGGEAVRARLIELLAELAGGEGARELDLSARPSVVMVCGVNGTGKTTTIGKLAWLMRHERDLSVLIAAADTYRAAAVEQLERWAERVGCELVKGAPGGDPAAVAFDAVSAAEARGVDVVIADTAGRLHTHGGLMEELAKVRRAMDKVLPGAPHETLLTIDATTGQNGVRQARAFAEAVDVTGVVLTKLDGTAKGGIALAIHRELGIPVKLVGTGEGPEDIGPFDPAEFAAALLGEQR
jgi:fused signal recognition particle receptor